ncbi:MAG: tRNA (adenosine(37)-N6)-threonylcarbamoyltransferase complex ATPase subunit type 1 TsaE [Limnohabitans sp.]|jgi:tRNA threonylcarbamoyladenosine biosynthesis protein TsaE|uniref:tRNA (adenosine(37)-N6)-threonylcarbamoyltransferase complex ATPase subunit type 1 TsaE n=1 Tax=Limnohabitans sp. TaxID=1907725 RepID=UPI0025F088AD|nr:tRNA (adenosine(37)-N6)-threonylcarbamoyltransferase complex ATPase subunit type 1 TsaE [Limnohabitans sp.]MCO4088805.1 tRNA (adenosine(37)-N6)-threonylcarbamoyltransferase complex ATPase subunit type 1 TsaE [Limnohabitans sp.]
MKVDLSTLSSHPPIVGSPNTTLAWEGLWPDESATQAFAQSLASQLQKWTGGRDARIELRGNLGTGKTTLVRHLLRAAGVQGRIKSPTYAVVEPHQVGSGEAAWPIWHFDFYRFNDPQEWEDAGFRDIFAGPGLKLMEWPDKVAGQLPCADWYITLAAMDEHSRHVHICAGTPQGLSWLQAWIGSAQDEN